jgi:hypothetical protein
MRYFVSAEVAEFVREHARSAAPGMEVGGALRVEGDRLTGYRPFVNASVNRATFQATRHPETGWLSLHSHPLSAQLAASAPDVQGMIDDGVAEIAIYVVRTDKFFVARRDASRPSRHEVIPVEVAPGPAVITPGQRAQIKRTADYAELLAMAAEPLRLDGAAETAAEEGQVLTAARGWVGGGEQPVDEPDRAGGIAWPDPGEDGVPTRIPIAASPLDLARRTHARRERARRARMPPADRSQSQAAEVPDGVYRTAGGRTLVVQTLAASAALAELRAWLPQPM